MLRDLGPEPGESILEIGTGTGWNAALLAELIGQAGVVSIEVDPTIAEAARRRLRDNGYPAVEVITGDGPGRLVPQAPYERVIATVGVTAVPHSWLAQTVPGGRIVVPLTNPYQPPGIAVPEGARRVELSWGQMTRNVRMLQIVSAPNKAIRNSPAMGTSSS